MILQRPLAGSSHLRESYIEISNYVRRRLLQQSPGLRNGPKPAPFGQRRLLAGAATKEVEQTNSNRNKAAVSGINIKTQRISQVTKEQYRILTHFERSSLTSFAPSTLHAWERLLKTKPDYTSHSDGAHIKICGYLTSQRSGKGVDFLQLVDPRMELAVQVVLMTESPDSSGNDQVAPKHDSEPDVGLDHSEHQRRWLDERFHLAKSIKGHTPVQVVGTVVPRQARPKKTKEPKRPLWAMHGAQEPNNHSEHTIQKIDPFVGQIDLISHVEIHAHFIKPLNSFPPDLIAKCDTVFPPQLRHLEFRTDHELRKRIRLRSKVAVKIREHMSSAGFDEIETPLLFKSTPEGAREFIVPTRKKGMAYALPQSPQQYKQVLMGSGINRYFQFAKCFRDEDLRTDRQPEFTQLDLEMSFASSAQVMAVVENILLESVWPNIPNIRSLQGKNLKILKVPGDVDDVNDPRVFPRYSYEEVMTLYGSDKPDTRLGGKIHRVDDWLPPNVKQMLTSLDDPIIEIMKFHMDGSDPAKSGQFIKTFLDAPSSAVYVNNIAGMPGVAVYDPRKPLSGLASLGYDGATRVEEYFKPEPGDILIVQARANARFAGGSTVLGNLRRDLYQSAISQELMPAPTGFSAFWVTDFPLFSPVEESEPGQGGLAGICSTHHPFTAPKKGQDLSKLLTDPLHVIGDHYDLVINGVEVGGGSRRVHTADMQELILREVLKMKPERVEDFRHLLNVLRSGCPPHAGFALGFDRLMAMLTGRATVRDVIAFPKYADGEDKLVGSPSPLTSEQLATYHLAVTDQVGGDSSTPISQAA